MYSKKNDRIRVRNRHFELTRKLGEGGTSQVWEACEKGKEGRYAMKIMSLKDKESQEMSASEIWTMYKLKHKNIVGLIDYDKDTLFHGEKVSAVVMEVVEKGELFDYIKQSAGMQNFEGMTHYIFTKLVDAMSYMHEQNITHRDIKPENILLGEAYEVKIADMGFATKFRSTKTGRRIALTQHLGSRGYFAPEIISNPSYTESVDIFSMGVVLFVLHAGFPPFRNPKKGDWWFDRLRKGKFDQFWASHERRTIFPDGLKKLLEGMMTVNPLARFDFKDIKANEWFQMKRLDDEKYIKTMHDLYRQINPECVASTPYPVNNLVPLVSIGGEQFPDSIRKEGSEYSDSKLKIKFQRLVNSHSSNFSEEDIVKPNPDELFLEVKAKIVE